MAPTRRSARVAAASKATPAAPPAAAPPAKAAKKKNTTKSTSKAKASKAKAAPKATATKAKRKARNQTQGSKKKAGSTTAKPTKKQKLSNLDTKVDREETLAPLGVVDPAAGVDGSIALVDEAAADAMLVLVDPAKSMDKYFVLQAIEKTDGSFVVYSRWGRTGSRGQALIQDFADEQDAVKAFCDKFKQKTGVDWTKRDEEDVVGGKYRYIQQDFYQKQSEFGNAKWQYWVDDGVDGKQDGWYDYDESASMEVERLFHEHQQNPNLNDRLVDSGSWTYQVDLVNLVQTNTTHPSHTSRRIRRVATDEEEEDVAAPTVASSSPAVLSTPTKQQPSASIVSPSPVKSNSSSTTSTTQEPPKTGKSHPVDPDISIAGRNTGDYKVVEGEDGKWYDVVLNQCNIMGGNNNNKYYRLQLLCKEDSDQFFCWQKWGRVGEPARASSSKFEGPFQSLEAGLKPFLKKYRDKTKNDFNADQFTAKPGKYVPIEIDNDVDVSDTPMATVKSEPDKEYLPSKLDPTTKDLMQVLFSKEMRNEALLSFNLDLKRLPLGVPSQQQIALGVSFLDKIEQKLNGTSITASYEELSSKFYTAIPHSFGRSQPPCINNKEQLQSRYDMCDILSDIYESNETVRQLEEKVKDVETVPALEDQHYDSLKAELTLLDKSSAEMKAILTYFEKTKRGSSKVLNVWKVDREGEGDSFQKYDKLGNRKLLWHGTNIAVVAPILTSGLRIMPHSGGRVGSGIYLANMQQKSAQYTSGYGSKYACMFLAEAALGKEHLVVADGSHASGLKKAPKGFDSVHAVGNVGPKKWGKINIDGKSVQVAAGPPEDQDKKSTFYHDEHLCYDEDQVRLRYVLTVKL
eukprot:scaffold15140_cov164-Cylindrotheca_fusiformis.AAC.3